MSDLFLFNTLSRTRRNILKQLEALPAEKRSVVPPGFNNNIHWQLGHIVTLAERILYGFSGKEGQLSANYPLFFASGTRPSEWIGEPPAWDEIMQVFQTQQSTFIEAFAENLDEPVKNRDNFAKAETIRHLLELNVSHESSHAGMITAMIRVLNL